MGKLNKLLLVVLAVALLLSGCTMATLDELYCLPKRSEEYENLQAVIDKAMQGLSYSAPIYGENRQALQMADLDGDGVDERILFAKDDSDKPLKILIFSELASGYVLMDTIEGYGFGFDFVDYAQLDDKPGLELIVGRQVSNLVMRSVSVYRFTSGIARQLMNASYHEIATTDLNQDGVSELFLLTAGLADKSVATARLCYYRDGEMQRTEELPLSANMSNFKLLKTGTLVDGIPAIYVTSAYDAQNLVTDVLTIHNGRLAVLYGSIITKAVDNYYVYPADIDADGVLELPRVLQMTPVKEDDPPHYMIQWYSLSSQEETLKQCTYHCFQQNWYLELDGLSITDLSVQQTENGVAFYDQEQPLFTILALTDADREQQSQLPGHIVLYASETVIFVAVAEDAELLGAYQEELIARFHPIRMDLNTEED